MHATVTDGVSLDAGLGAGQLLKLAYRPQIPRWCHYRRLRFLSYLLAIRPTPRWSMSTDQPSSARATLSSSDANSTLWSTVALRSVFGADRKSTRLNSSHVKISYAVFCLKKKKKYKTSERIPSLI